jgi:hypothetical protein
MGASGRGSSVTRRASMRVLVGVALVLAAVGVLGASAGATAPTTWGPPTPLSGVNFSLQMPKVTIDAAGTATALWSGGDTYYDRTIRTSTQPAGGSWSAPVTLADEGDDPVLAGNSTGEAVAAWEADDGAIRASTRGVGTMWTPTTTISVGADAVAKASTPKVAIDESGGVIVVWQQRDFPFVRVWSARATAGGGWSAPALVATNPADYDMRPAVALDADGDAVVAWTVGVQGASTVQVRTSAGLVWSPVTQLDGGPGAAAGPAVGIDDAGDAVVMWALSGADTSLRSALRPAGGGWSPATDVAGAPASDPSVVMDPQGATTAAWSTYTVTGLVVFAAHRTLTTPWSTPVALSAPGAETTGLGPVISGNRAGDVAAAWEHRGGDPQRSVVQVSSRATGADWSPTVTVSGPDQDSSSADAAIDAHGDAVVAYLDRTFDGLSPTSRAWTVRSPAPTVAPSAPPAAPRVELVPRFTG